VRDPNRPRRFQRVPIRYLLPNLVTLIALCSGVTAIRLGIEGRFELAVSCVIFAIVLDAVDGRLARYLEGTSKFGAELDSLADFVNFGVAPAILLYFWSLNSMLTLGWVICLFLAIACALRLARFNVMLEDPNKSVWASHFFSGVPAPAGAGLALLPMYAGFLDIVPDPRAWSKVYAAIVFAVAVLMVSQVPTYSGKNIKRVPREIVLPLLAISAATVVCLIAFPWHTLMVFAVVYVVMIPLAVRSYRKHKRADALASASVEQ
jgi:CDP-diacylglycerol---serine O-phosphatidyltransferase